MMDKVTWKCGDGSLCWNRDAIEKLEKQVQALQWIPVSERLPDCDGMYLVSYRNEVMGSWFRGGKWYIANDAKHCWKGMPYKYWMPLPEPPTDQE